MIEEILEAHEKLKKLSDGQTCCTTIQIFTHYSMFPGEEKKDDVTFKMYIDSGKEHLEEVGDNFAEVLKKMGGEV